MSGIGRLSSQFLAAMETAGAAPGPRPGDSSGATKDHNPAADFSGHLADLVERDAKSNVSDGNARNSGSIASALAKRDFSPVAKPAETTPHSAGRAILDPSVAKPSDRMVTSAAMTGIRPRSKALAARSVVPTFRQSESGGSPKPGTQLGSAAAMPPGLSLPADLEKPVGKTNSPEDPESRQSVAKNSGLPPLSANETNLLVTGTLTGAFLTASMPDVVSAVADEDGSLTRAAGQTASAESDGLNGMNTQKRDLASAQVPAAEGRAKWNRNLNSSSLVSVKITAVDQETHLAPARALLPGGNLAALTELSSRETTRGLVGGSTVPGETPPQTANQNLDAADAELRGNSFARIPAQPMGGRD